MTLIMTCSARCCTRTLQRAADALGLQGAHELLLCCWQIVPEDHACHLILQCKVLQMLHSCPCAVFATGRGCKAQVSQCQGILKHVRKLQLAGKPIDIRSAAN